MTDKLITVAKVPSLISPERSESRAFDHFQGLTIRQAVAPCVEELQAKGYCEFVIQVNGFDTQDLDAWVNPGDFISITPKHGAFALAPLILAILPTFMATSLVASVIATAVMVGAGILVSNLFSASTPATQGTDSPTYGFNAVNSSVSGGPVAVVYGNVRTTPQILNSYRRTSADYNMWAYLLLGLGAGTTNNNPTINDVFLGEEPLSNYTDSYFRITSGSVTPSGDDESALSDKFSSIYHDRAMDRQLKFNDLVLSAVAAVGTMTVDGTPLPDEHFTIGTQTWTFKEYTAGAFEIVIGAYHEITMTNIETKINAESTFATFSASTGAVTARTAGASGNSIVFTTNCTVMTLDGSGFLGGTTAGKDAIDPDTVYHLETMGQVDQVMIMITFPYGVFEQKDDGLHALTIEMAYGYRKIGDTGAITWSTASLYGKGTQAIRKELWISFSERAKYEIYLNRNTADDPTDESKQRSSSFLTSLTEILNIFMTYPGIQCAVIGVKASDNLSGSLPAIRVVQNKTSVTVPNFNGVGTQNVDPSNHSWALFDALTNPYYGRKVPATSIIESAWTEWREWCDGLVDGNKRAQLNMVFDSSGNFSDNCIKFIEESGRCKILRCGDYWSVAVDKPRPLPSYTFSRGNIVKDSFHWEGFEDPEKVDAVQISYYDKDRNWKKKTVFAKASWYDTLTKEPMVAKLELLSINNRDQATREAIFRIQKNVEITRYGSLASPFAAAGLELLDRVDIIHRSIPFGFSGRLTGLPSSAWPEDWEDDEDFDPNAYVAATTLYLDQIINMPSADYSGKAAVLVIDYQGNRQEFTVTGPFDVDTLNVSISGGTFTGRRWDIWAIGRPTEDRLAYQITGKKMYSKQTIAFDFVEYSELMFYHADYEDGAVEI